MEKLVQEEFYISPTTILNKLPQDLDEIYLVARSKEEGLIVAGSYGGLRTIKNFAQAIDFVIEGDDESGN